MFRRLENWTIGNRVFESLPPELGAHINVCGQVYGDPSRPDGEWITTTHLLSAEGREVRTASGSVYLLGEPSDRYFGWLLENRPGWDRENPVTVAKKKATTTCPGCECEADSVFECHASCGYVGCRGCMPLLSGLMCSDCCPQPTPKKKFATTHI